MDNKKEKIDIDLEFEKWFSNITLLGVTLDQDTKEWMLMAFIGGATMQVNYDSKETTTILDGILNKLRDYSK